MLLFASRVAAAERYAVVVTGASGGPEYARKYRGWREAFAATLRGKLGFPADHVTVLGEEEGEGVVKATRDNVRAVLEALRRRTSKEDVVLVLLIGHGTSDGEEAKFNLIGPDLSAAEWAALLKPIPGRIVFVDGASGSFPFLEKLAGPSRIVVTANDSSAQQFETVFPDYFIKAFDDPTADRDRNGKVSIWEAFSYASAAVRQTYQQKGQLATERPLLDDSGTGIGREADADTPGSPGAIAQVTYLQADAPIDAPANSELAVLLKRRLELESQLELLKARKATLPADEYDSTLERLLLDLARLERQIRTKS